MNRLLFPMTLLAALLTTSVVLAATEHVDPEAPCFRWPATDWDGDGVFDRIDRCNNTPHGCTVDKWGCTSDADDDGVCDGLDQCPDTPADTKVNAHGCSSAQSRSSYREPEQVKAPEPVPVAPPVEDEVQQQLRTKGRIRLENVYFEKGNAQLLPESEESLSRVAAGLNKYPDLRFEIEGHTDTRGSARYNQRLSQDRAEAVRRVLIDRYGIAPDRLTAVGYGESRPETDERNEEELLRNRRVELRVLNPEALPGVKVEQKN